MTDSKHTPGPWRYGPTGSVMMGYCQPFAVAERGSKNLIAGCFGDTRGGPDTAEANARLIAAAPDLLEAAKRALDYAQSLNSEMTAAYGALLSAIAKAEGRS